MNIVECKTKIKQTVLPEPCIWIWSYLIYWEKVPKRQSCFSLQGSFKCLTFKQMSAQSKVLRNTVRHIFMLPVISVMHAAWLLGLFWLNNLDYLNAASISIFPVSFSKYYVRRRSEFFVLFFALDL